MEQDEELNRRPWSNDCGCEYGDECGGDEAKQVEEEEVEVQEQGNGVNYRERKEVVKRVKG